MEEGPFCNRHFFVKAYRKFVMKYLFIVKDSAVYFVGINVFCVYIHTLTHPVNAYKQSQVCYMKIHT